MRDVSEEGFVEREALGGVRDSGERRGRASGSGGERTGGSGGRLLHAIRWAVILWNGIRAASRPVGRAAWSERVGSRPH